MHPTPEECHQAQPARSDESWMRFKVDGLREQMRVPSGNFSVRPEQMERTTVQLPMM